MRHLVTGCSGFVGPFLLSEIRRHDPGAVVFGVDRFPSQSGNLDHFENIDLLDGNRLQQTISSFRPHTVFHLAAVSSVAESWKEPSRSFQNNIQSFLNLLEALRSASPETRVLSVGSSEEYGTQDPTAMPLREPMACNPVSPYAVARVAQAHMSRVYSNGFGLKIISTRSFNHSGPGQRDQFFLSAMAKRFAQMSKDGERILRVGNLKVTRDFSDVRDVVRAYTLLLDKGKPGEVYNVCSGQGIPLESIVESLERIAGFTVTRHVDSGLLRPDDPPSIYGSIEKITRDTGWKPEVSIQQTLKDLYERWLQAI